MHIDENANHATQCFIGGYRAELHDVGCHILQKACLDVGPKSQRERGVIVPALATSRMTEPRVDVDACGHPELPHIRLGVAIVNADAQHCSQGVNTSADKAPAAAVNEQKNPSMEDRQEVWRWRSSWACSDRTSTLYSSDSPAFEERSAALRARMRSDRCKNGEGNSA